MRREEEEQGGSFGAERGGEVALKRVAGAMAGAEGVAVSVDLRHSRAPSLKNKYQDQI